MRTFEEVINKAIEEHKKPIRDVMSFHKTTIKNNITDDIIKKSEEELDRLTRTPPQSQGDYNSINWWIRIHKVFLYNAKKKGGRKRSRRKRRRRTKKRKSRRRKKRSRRRRRKKR